MPKMYFIINISDKRKSQQCEILLPKGGVVGVVEATNWEEMSKMDHRNLGKSISRNENLRLSYHFSNN